MIEVIDRLFWYLTALEAIKDAVEDNRIVISEVVTPMKTNLHANALG